MEKTRREKSILGKFNDMSHKLVMMLVFPIAISLFLMLFYAWDYHSAIVRMESVTELKNVVADEIPEIAWNIVSGRDEIRSSGIYYKLHEVRDSMESISEKTGSENRLYLTVAGRTMQTLENYVDRIRDNIEDDVPVAENEAVLAEIRDVAALVDDMLNEYISREIATTAKMSLTLRVVIIITAVVELLILISALWFRKKTMKDTAEFVRNPIESLEGVAASIAEGKLDARLTDTDVTELRNLTLQVNTMADRLEEMMEKSIKDARTLRKAELRTLQAQINPHFLYNTLDAIVWKAEAGDKNEVIQLTSALSDFFRISLSSGADWIPISQEKKHIEGYLRIQQTRYRDIMHYEIDIPEEIGHYYILKLLLQPLVENALYHGIKIKRGGGTIKVSACMEEGFLKFSVADTGLGMTKDQLEALEARMKKEGPAVNEGKSGGFGLVNVNLRIRLYYNVPDGLMIESGPGGTTVSFKVPLRTKEDIETEEPQGS